MNLDEQRRRYRALSDWLESPQGRYAVSSFLRQLSRHKQLWPRISKVLQIGWHHPMLRRQAKRTYSVSPCLDNAPSLSLIASTLKLPLKRNSVDVIIAPMLFEVFASAKGHIKNPLDELDRVLSPMGHIVLWGVNPLSLWGGALSAHQLLLGHAGMRPYSPLKIKHSLMNRGYEQKAFDSFYYVPPFQTEGYIQKSLFLNEMGKMIAVFPAGFYILIMQKYQPIAPKRLVATQEAPLWLPSA